MGWIRLKKGIYDRIRMVSELGIVYINLIYLINGSWKLDGTIGLLDKILWVCHVNLSIGL